MALSRNTRVDRRRLQLLEATAEMSSVSPPKRTRRSAPGASLESRLLATPDEGFSESVHRYCRMRVLDALPVRSLSSGAAVGGLWALWLMMVGLHWWIYVRPGESTNPMPLLYLFHLRSPHGIAQCLVLVALVLTTLMCWLTYRLRSCQMNDYHAKYRIWWVMVLAAGWMTIDASTSLLRLVGASIDRWTQAQLGYPGWGVAAVAASIVAALLGIRMCDEFRNAKGSLVHWLIGLAAWIGAGLYGTGLLKIGSSPATLDWWVGSCWLAGVLAVFIAVAQHLQMVYVAAQRDLLERRGLVGPNAKALSLHWIPGRYRKSVGLKKAGSDQSGEDGQAEEEKEPIQVPGWVQWVMRVGEPPPKAEESLLGEEEQDDVRAGNTASQASAARSAPEAASDSIKSKAPSTPPVGSASATASTNAATRNPAAPVPAAGVASSGKTASAAAPKSSSIEKGKATADPVESDSSSGRSWIPWKRKAADPVVSSEPSGKTAGKATAKGGSPEVAPSDSSSGRSWIPWKRKPVEESLEKSDTDAAAGDKPGFSWWKRKDGQVAAVGAAASGEGRTQLLGRLMAKLKRSSDPSSEDPVASSQKSGKAASADVDSGSEGTGWKRWLPGRKSTETEEVGTAKGEVAAKSSSTPGEGATTKKGLFGFMDALKLKPPAEEREGEPQFQEVASKSPEKATQRAESYEDDDDEDDSQDSGRPLSKAEKKRLRREQMQKRAG
ncbi:MAG: hypothetical protein ACK5ZC_16850 [Pirellulaceae bacterium]|jgi:hypothetical protein